MYFGALAIGADLAAGLLAMERIRESEHRIDLLFKDMHADFLKRVEGDAHFTCREGAEIGTQIAGVIQSGERENMPVHIDVTAPDVFGDEILASFKLTLSLKVRA